MLIRRWNSFTSRIISADLISTGEFFGSKYDSSTDFALRTKNLSKDESAFKIRRFSKK